MFITTPIDTHVPLNDLPFIFAIDKKPHQRLDKNPRV